MSRVTRSLSMLGACLAVCVVAAPIAQASEGPFFDIAEGRLLIGETQEAESASTKPYELTTSTIKIHCEKEKGEKVVLSGSISTTGSSGEEAMVFESCTTSGNGTKCELEGKKFKSERLTSKLDYSNKEEKASEQVLTALAPVSGGVFAKLRFAASEGGKCASSEIIAEGSVGGEELEGKETVVKLGENEAESETDYVNLPGTPLKTEWFEEESVRKEAAVGLKLGKEAATLSGRSSIKLPGGKKLGIFTGQTSGRLWFKPPTNRLFAAVDDTATVTLENTSSTTGYKVTNIALDPIIAGGPYFELEGASDCEKEIAAEATCSFTVKYIKKSASALTPEGVLVKIQGTNWRPAALMQGQ
jgi:hypothetical protein